MGMRGVRGAITVEKNEKAAIWQAAKAMMQELIERNELAPEDIGAVIFSMTEDLTAAFPTAGVRQLPGFDLVPLFDARQCAIEGSLEKCILVLIYAEHHGIGTKSYKISTTYCTFYIKSCRIDGVRGFIRNFQNQVVRRDTL